MGAPAKAANLHTAAKILSCVGTALALMGTLYNAQMAAAPFVPRAKVLPALPLAVAAFVTMLLGVIFYGVAHKQAFKGGLAAGTFFPHAALGPSWRAALFSTIFAGACPRGAAQVD